jgi:hypothetical protein
MYSSVNKVIAPQKNIYVNREIFAAFDVFLNPCQLNSVFAIKNLMDNVSEISRYLSFTIYSDTILATCIYNNNRPRLYKMCHCIITVEKIPNHSSHAGAAASLFLRLFSAPAIYD